MCWKTNASQFRDALIAKGGENAHPSVWAPFVLVGNGGL
jgi:hypothetical protein